MARNKRMLPKKTVIAGVIAVVIAAAAIGGIVWKVNFAPPTKQDFATAQVTIEAIRRSHDSVANAATAHSQAAVMSLRSGDNEGEMKAATTQQRDVYDDAIKSYRDSVTRLEDSPALRDDEVEADYVAVKNQRDTFLSFYDGLTRTYSVFYTTRISCDDVSRFKAGPDAKQSSTKYAAVAKDCLSDLGVLSKTTFAPLASYGTEYASIVRATQASYADAAKDTSKAQAIAKQQVVFTDRTRKLDPLADIDKARTAATNSDALNKLGKLLAMKERQL